MRLKYAIDRDSGVLTMILVCVGALSARLAMTEPGTPWYWPPLIILAYSLLAMFISWLNFRTRWFSKRGGDASELTWLGLLLGLIVLLGPFIEGGARISTALNFRPLEQVTILALTNFAFFALAFPGIQRSESAATGVSLVLVMASLMLGENRIIVPLVSLYGSLCVVWLAAGSWLRMAAVTRNGYERRLPYVPVSCLVVLVVGVTIASSRVADGMPNIWGEWVPSSGGSRWANPSAILGVGDGDWVVSGPDAKSTGPVDSDYFLESDQPTIYDAIMESYGEARPPGKLLRTIVVRQEQLLGQQGHKAPNVGSAGRQFSVYRKGRSQQSKLKNEDANALLYAEGQTPLHLAMTVYEFFDGINWHEPKELQTASDLELRDQASSWLWVPKRPERDIFGGLRTHHLRFGQLSSERLPLPNHLERLRLGEHDSLNLKKWADDVFVWAHDGILRAPICIPSGISMELSSGAVDRSILFESDTLVGGGANDDACLSVPDHLRSSAESLAGRFSEFPRGWTQIHAVMDHLRTHYEHDQDATVPATCEDPIHHFLHHAQRGPAYQFVTAATLALRSLGYPTRVVSGFYVDEDDYVARGGYTPIHLDDVHFWLEVRMESGNWITFDPTPGYQTEWYQASLFEQVQAALSVCVGPLMRNPLSASSLLILVVILWWNRLRVRERVLTWLCMWWPTKDVQRRLGMTLRVLDLRSQLSGTSRPPGKTPNAWYGHLDDDDLQKFLILFYRAMYGHTELTATAQTIARTCRATMKATALSRLRQRMSES